MALSRSAYVNLLRSQAGYHEGRDPSGNWNNLQKFSPATADLEWSQNQAWCHVFVSWGADELGGRDVIPITASCAAGVAWWKARGRWTDYPVLGAPFYMGSAGQDHVGVVYAYDADSIFTIEGNTNSGGSYQGDGVYQRVRPRRGAGSPYGYGVPAFSEATISADPKLGGTASAVVPTTPTPTPAPPEEDSVALTQERSDQWNSMIWGLKNTTESTLARLTALATTIDTLAKLVAADQGLDAAAVGAAVKKAVTEALAASTVDVSVNVHDKTGA